jgi:hypothetical protein
MDYVRVSHMIPRAGQEARVREVLEKLSAFYQTQDGYLAGWRLDPHQGADPIRMGRVGVWASEEEAERAAQTSHAMSLRAELIRLVDEDSHLELSFQGTRDKN